jgi:hypothetical protein
MADMADDLGIVGETLLTSAMAPVKLSSEQRQQEEITT